jgi:cell wall-associated NlpC family hydrolase
VRPAAAAVRQAARQAAARERATIATVRREARERRAAERRKAQQRRAAERRVQARELRERAAEVRQVTPHAEESRRSVVRRAHTRKRVRARVVRTGVPGRMAAVLSFARAQIGKRYRAGGEGPNSFDCSGFTKRAYAQIGLRLPHSSRGQAARARAIPRWAARPGDLVVGPGHVGVYMGRGMMIDAGNRRTGVVYRRLYAGLRVERL